MSERRLIRYQGVEYDLQAATQRAAIGDLRELLRVSGISAKKIALTLVGMSDMESILDVYESEERLEVWAAMLFLCLRKAGRKDYTFDDALEVPLMDIVLILQTEDEGVDDGAPKGPTTPDGPEVDAENSPT